jgi:hypothetical protein
MKSISKVIEKYKKQTLSDADGDAVTMELQKKSSKTVIEKFEKQSGAKLPSQLKELYSLSNGADLFGSEIVPIEAVLYEPDFNAFQFHGWGNGDFDYIMKDGQIAFLDNRSRKLVPFAKSLAEWAEKVILETKKNGCLSHPDDFLNYEEKDALYYPVYLKIKTPAERKKAKGKKKPKAKPVSEPVSKSANKELNVWQKVYILGADKNFRAFEDRIAAKNGAKISRKYSDADLHETGNCIATSLYSLETVWKFLQDNEKQIHAFDDSVWDAITNEGWSFQEGFSLRTGIYLCYLKDKNFDALRSYLLLSDSRDTDDTLTQIKKLKLKLV